MQYVANHLPLITGAVRDAARKKQLWWYRSEQTLVIIANLLCTLCFSYLLYWLAGEMWQDLVR
jgi:hypothetical protein